MIITLTDKRAMAIDGMTLQLKGNEYHVTTAAFSKNGKMEVECMTVDCYTPNENGELEYNLDMSEVLLPNDLLDTEVQPWSIVFDHLGIGE